jgi:hypothetical protein
LRRRVRVGTTGTVSEGDDDVDAVREGRRARSLGDVSEGEGGGRRRRRLVDAVASERGLRARMVSTYLNEQM